MALTDTVFMQEFRSNWRVLLVAFTCFLFAFSAPAFLMPFIYPEVIEAFGWTREQATLLASAKYLTGSIIAIAVGRFIDVMGVRKVLIAVSVIGGLAMVSFLWTPNLTIYYAAGVMLGFAGAGTMVAIKVLISRTFHASQGTAMGIAMLGTSVGGVIVPLVITWLIETYGWRVGSALLSAGVWIVALPLMVFFLTDESFESAEAKDTLAPHEPAALSRVVVSELAMQPQFWLIALAVFAAGFVDQAFIQHQVLYLKDDLGMSASHYAGGIAAMGLLGIVIRPLVGGLFDKMSTRGVSLSYMMLAFGSLFALGAINPYLFAAFVVFRAIGHSAVLLDTTVLAKHTFGLKNIGIILGVYTGAVNLGFATGPWFMARMFVVTGSYVTPFIICCGVAIFAAAVLIPVKPVYWLDLRARSKSGLAAYAVS
ncbi:MAG: MFS transporter [Proteobacteria bacterium]|nr:MFS transporter [Pseudomonadota bacterium]